MRQPAHTFTSLVFLGTTFPGGQRPVPKTPPPTSLVFTINYLATFTAPFVQSTLLDSDFIWTRVATGDTTATKTPAASFFAGSGQYTLACTDLTQITGICLEQSVSRDWLRSTNLDGLLQSLTGLTRLSAYNNSAYADNISTWVLPNSVQTFWVDGTAVTGSLTNFYIPPALVSLKVNNTNVSGDIRGWILSTTLATLHVQHTAVTYSRPGSSFSSLVTGCSVDAHDCGWTQAMVDSALVDADASGAQTSTISLGGTNASPGIEGYLSYQDLLVKTWTATITSPVVLQLDIHSRANYTNPDITADSLTDSDVAWIRPDHTYVRAKAPGAMFSQTGIYTVFCTDWSLVGSINLSQAAPRDWLQSTNLSAMLASPGLPGINRIAAYNNSAFNDDISTWVMPDSTQALLVDGTAVTGDITDFYLPHNLAQLSIHTTSVTGDIGGWILPVHLEHFFFYNTSLTGNIALWTIPAVLDSLSGFDCTGISYGPSGTSLTGITDSAVIKLYDCGFAEAEVNKILADLVTSNASNGTLELGGNSAPPTGQGLTDITHLVDIHNWTIVVNPVILSFTINYQSILAFDPPRVYSTLPNSEFTWTRVATGATTTTKTPATGFFAGSGQYTLTCTDWSTVTGIYFEQADHATDWLRTTNLAHLFPYLTGMTSISVYNNSAFADDISTWTLPDSLHTADLDRTAVTGSIANFHIPPTLTSLAIHTTSVTGDISGWSLPASLVTLHLYHTGVTYSAGSCLSDMKTGDNVDAHACGWTEAMVDKALLDAYASAAGSGTVLKLDGTNAGPSMTGYLNCLDLRARGWTVTVTTPASALQFVLNYQASYTPAYITAAGLSDSNVVWVRPNSTYVQAKAPGSIFSQSGTYHVLCSNWNLVTEVMFGQSTSKDWLRSTNLATLFATYPYSIGRLDVHNNSAFADDISTWTLTNSMQYCLLNNTAATGDITSFSLPPSLLQLSIHTTSVTGDISGWSLPPYLNTLLFNNTSLTGNIALWTIPGTPTISGYACPGISYGPSGTAFAGAANNSYIKLYDCVFTDTEVNKILADLVTSGAVDGTLDLGGNSVVPTGQGELDRAHLTNTHGWTIIAGNPVTLTFTINYQATITAPYVQSTLLNSEFTWTRVATGATTSTKTPAASFFAGSGQYTLFCLDGTKIAGIHFEQSVSRDWLRSTNLAALFPTLPGLTVLATNLNSAYADNISTWVLPSSLTQFYMDRTAITGDLTGFALPSALVDFYVYTTGVTGDLSTITLPGTLAKLYIHNTAMTYGTGASLGGMVTGSSVNASGCGWTKAMVDKALLDASTSAAGASTALNLSGTDEGPSLTGYLTAQDLLARSWVVTLSAMTDITLQATINSLGAASVRGNVTSPTLADADVVWVSPNHTYVSVKSPPQSFWTSGGSGVYTVFCTDWSQITEIDLSQTTSKDWLRTTNLATLFTSLTGLLSYKASLNNAYADNISLWTVPDSVQTLLLDTTRVSGSVTSFHLPTSLQYLNIHSAFCSGSVAGWSLPTGLKQIDLECVLVSGNFALWTLPTTLTSLKLYGTSFTYGPSGTSLTGVQDNTTLTLTCFFATATPVNKILADLVTSNASNGILSTNTADPTGQGLTDRTHLRTTHGWTVNN